MHQMDFKLKRLIEVSKMYYQLDMTQGEIAKKIGVSRPMVSKLLAEAKGTGVVKITITQFNSHRELLAKKIEEKFELKVVSIAESSKDSNQTINQIAKTAWDLIEAMVPKNASIGLGWGSMIGKMSEQMSATPQWSKAIVHPLVGGINASYLSYHPNELVRIFCEKTGAQSKYIYMPAIFDTMETKAEFENTNIYRTAQGLWNTVDFCILNISNFPSTPDIATAYCYGNSLIKKGAVGHLLAHFYNIKGEVITPNNNVVMQISNEQLANCKNTIAIAAPAVLPESVFGSLTSKLITHLVIDEDMANKLLIM